MITLIEFILKLVFKGLSLGAKVALNRAVIIVMFAATIGTTFTAIYQNLSDASSKLSQVVQSVEDISSTVGNWVNSNEYFNLICYALSLDVLFSGITTALFWCLCTLGGFLLTALFTVFISVAPLFAELVVASLRRQYAQATAHVAS